MKTKYCILFLILSIITFIGYLVLITFFNDDVSGIIHVFMLLLSCIFLLPYSIYSIQPEQKPTPVDWRIFYSVIFFIVVFVICLIVAGISVLK